MNTVVLAFPGNELLANKITTSIDAEAGRLVMRKFPDGESFVLVQSDVSGKQVMVVATLDHPDSKFLPLFYLCKKLKADGAAGITLIAPYLAYMRQDKSFHKGEVVTSDHFASLLSSMADRLVTVDPHLHRHHSLDELFSIPCSVLHSSNFISKWINDHVNHPVLIGPDSESEQWVSQVAAEINAPFITLRKERLGDRVVRVSIPEVEQFKSFTPVLLDDIICTARTMIETLKHLKEVELGPAVCIAVHALFADNGYEELVQAGASAIVTCNTIPHASNQIDLTDLIIQSVNGLV